MSRNPPFVLSKWYFDCVADDGHTFIGYLGELRWKSLAIHYQSMLVHRDGGGTRVQSSLRRGRPPVVTGNSLSWKSTSLQVEGTWNALERPVQATILESDAGNIEWTCLQPRARANVRVGRSVEVCGLGYAEHLRMTIPPWRLPLKELHWGRFLSETDSLVWIDWRGPHSKRMVFHNGTETQAESITRQQVVLQGEHLVMDLESSCVLREGILGKTALPILRKVQKLIPRQVLGIRECKWRSRGVLRRRGRAEASGWAIHEVVQWP
ncbi:MAG: hypothetical protein HY234_03025 [Acidobacteria bacterium]|nr:hypothetical protein [Acidobacteriota bacterium]MBI3662009.1 hypothetical protein [Acidobacteriota bacterium]